MTQFRALLTEADRKEAKVRSGSGERRAGSRERGAEGPPLATKKAGKAGLRARKKIQMKNAKR